MEENKQKLGITQIEDGYQSEVDWGQKGKSSREKSDEKHGIWKKKIRQKNEQMTLERKELFNVFQLIHIMWARE